MAKVLTPGGFRDESLVHRIEPGKALTMSNGALRKLDLATHQITDFAPPAPGPHEVPALGSGWISYAFWDNTTGTPVSSLATTWQVPAAPSTQSGQTIFLFNGIQNTGANYGILQPVLQWGGSAAGGGNYWSIASWYVTSGGQAFHTSLVNVNPGDMLVGVMTLTGQTGGSFNYTSQFQGIPNTSLPVQNIAELHWCNETLEAYSIAQCSNYPASWFTPFTALSLSTGNTHPSITWTVNNSVVDCGQHTVIVSNSSTNGAVNIYYRESQPSSWHWANQGTPAGNVTAGVGVVTVMDTPSSSQRPYAFIEGGNGHLWVDWWNGSQWAWSDQGAPAAGVAVNAGVGVCTVKDTPSSSQRPYAFVRGSDGHLWVDWWSGSQWAWSNQGAPAANVAVNAGVGVCTVMDTTSSSQRPYAFVRGSDGHLWVNWWNGSQWAWSNQGVPAAGVTVSSGVGVCTVMDTTSSSQRPYAFVRGSDGHLWINWWNGSQWVWSNQGVPAAGVTVSSGVGVCTVMDTTSSSQRPYAFVQGSNGHLWINWWNGSQWGWADQGVPAAGIQVSGSVGAITVKDSPSASQRPYAFVRGSDTHLYVNWWG